MKKITTLLFLAMLTISSYAQISDSINAMPGYSQDVFYSLENSTVKSVSSTNWTIAFSTNSYSLSAYINDGRGVELYETSYAPADFDILDTTGMSFNSNYNRYSDWSSSAFEENATGPMNYGWGEYNSTTHIIEGTRVYVLKTISGKYLKILIEEKAMGVWKLKYNALDNSDLQTFTIDGTLNEDRNFVYLDIDNDMLETDREPLSSEWDLLFTKYYDIDIPYVVTGILANEGLEIAQVDGVNTSSSTYVGQNFTDNVKEIGSDWKSFNTTTFSFDIEANRSYFVKKDASTADDEIFNYYKIVFTSFEGTATGKFHFTKELVASDTTATVDTTESPNSINVLNNLTVVSLYPNPSFELANILIEGKKDTKATITILNNLGQKVYSGLKNLNEDLNVLEINVSSFEKGLYFVKIQNEGKSKLLKLQVE